MDFESAVGYYEFFDLGLISTFLANTAKGKVFVDDWGISHLSVHFTPTLFLITPFFKFFKSQFLLISNVLCISGITYFFWYLYNQIKINFNDVKLQSLFILFFIMLLLFK